MRGWACQRKQSSTARGRRVLAALFLTSGVLHLVVPSAYERIVPRRLPHKHALVKASGVIELVCAAGLQLTPTRRAAGLVSAGLLAAIFPANIQMAVDVFAKGGGPLAKALVTARLPLQVPLIRIAWRAWRR